jgi:hypothetical protein
MVATICLIGGVFAACAITTTLILVALGKIEV